mmetsp:Transcript_16952/g.39700  ORF Transcript_16952/g.39700 Transcript_16952/m.39700 type:complete len:292 (+) Transcript_16952:276-1151(+)
MPRVEAHVVHVAVVPPRALVPRFLRLLDLGTVARRGARLLGRRAVAWLRLAGLWVKVQVLPRELRRLAVVRSTRVAFVVPRPAVDAGEAARRTHLNPPVRGLLVPHHSAELRAARLVPPLLVLLPSCGRAFGDSLAWLAHRPATRDVRPRPLPRPGLPVGLPLCVVWRVGVGARAGSAPGRAEVVGDHVKRPSVVRDHVRLGHVGIARHIRAGVQLPWRGGVRQNVRVMSPPATERGCIVRRAGLGAPVARSVCRLALATGVVCGRRACRCRGARAGVRDRAGSAALENGG